MWICLGFYGLQETTCSKQRRAEHARLNRTLMGMYKYRSTAVMEAIVTLHADTALPRRRSDKALSIPSASAVLLAEQPRHLVPFPMAGMDGSLHGLCELEDKFKMICLLTCRRLWWDRGLQLNLSLLLISFLQPVQLGWEPAAANRPCCEPLIVCFSCPISVGKS